MRIRTGSCLCGAVGYRVEGEPLRVGLCHCADCRKSSGSAFVFFAVWPRRAFAHSGEIATFAGRSFCPACGSRLFCLREEAAEIRLGSLDSPPTDLAPDHEIWIRRREPWLNPLPGAGQSAGDAD
ncbi:GFA family protein [Rhizobium redzepovicii]